MNQLSLKALQRCEEAQEPVCHCRCGGLYHGKKRNGDSPADRAFFEGLPDNDPHHLLSKDEQRELRNARNREKTRLKNEKIAETWKKLYERQP